MKRFTLVALLVAATVVCVSRAASAGNTNSKTQTYVLTPTSSALPDAGGLATWTISGPTFMWWPKVGRVKVWAELETYDLWGLMPNTTYNIYIDQYVAPWPVLTTDSSGKVYAAQYKNVRSGSFPALIHVTDTATGTLVLTSK